MPDPAPASAPAVVLGAGYAGLTLAHEAWRRSKGALPIQLVDRHPVHVLRTELYEIGRIAADRTPERWAVPLGRVFERTSVEFRQANVMAIDLAARVVRTDAGDLPYRALAICLGNVAAFYGVPGAEQHAFQVYRLSGAQRLAAALTDLERASAGLPGERRPRVVVVGGGSTGTELAAEIATADWRRIADPKARPPEVVLVAGSMPFLDGFPAALVEHARSTLRKVGVSLIYGYNTTRVEPGKVYLEDGTVLATPVVAWCAGVQAPTLVRDLPVPHGRGGRVRVEPTLELPGYPGVFAVGDVAEFRDPATGITVPAMAQAAISEARTAAENLLARWNDRPLRPFSYRERGVIVALGIGRGIGNVGRVTLWGRPAALLKRLVEREYAHTVERGEPSRVL